MIVKMAARPQVRLDQRRRIATNGKSAGRAGHEDYLSCWRCIIRPKNAIETLRYPGLPGLPFHDVEL